MHLATAPLEKDCPVGGLGAGVPVKVPVDEIYSPRMAYHQLLLPALIQQWCQLRFSYWLERWCR
jgi:hypothetical protein